MIILPLDVDLIDQQRARFFVWCSGANSMFSFQLQRKRHIGNDIVCVVFLEADNTQFSPSCIKSHFLHTFIVVRCSPKIKFKPPRYEVIEKDMETSNAKVHLIWFEGKLNLFQVSVVTRDEVGAYKPYLWEQSTFNKGPMFREWMLTKVSAMQTLSRGSISPLKSRVITRSWPPPIVISFFQIVNAERASYSAPKFARMQERTRSQMLEDLVANLQNHAETGQIPKPYRWDQFVYGMLWRSYTSITLHPVYLF